MFDVFLVAPEGKDRFTLTIAGCPSNGIPAIDFRVGAGLPPAPTNRIACPQLVWTDEVFVRENADLADEDADLPAESIGHPDWRWQTVTPRDSEPVRALVRLAGQDLYFGEPLADAPVIVAYLANPCPETGRELIRNILSQGERLRLAAMEKE